LRPLRQAIKHCVQHQLKDRIWFTRAHDIASFCFSLKPGIVPGSCDAAEDANCKTVESSK
jgi:hypothetical protein